MESSRYCQNRNLHRRSKVGGMRWMNVIWTRWGFKDSFFLCHVTSWQVMPCKVVSCHVTSRRYVMLSWIITDMHSDILWCFYFTRKKLKKNWFIQILFNSLRFQLCWKSPLWKPIWSCLTVVMLVRFRDMYLQLGRFNSWSQFITCKNQTRFYLMARTG